MAFAAMFRRAGVRVSCAYRNHMFVDMVCVRMMQVAIMQVIGMAFMLYGGMTAIRAMLVGMVAMGFAFGHSILLKLFDMQVYHAQV
jgi:hypothetical protein